MADCHGAAKAVFFPTLVQVEGALLMWLFWICEISKKQNKIGV